MKVALAAVAGAASSAAAFTATPAVVVTTPSATATTTDATTAAATEATFCAALLAGLPHPAWVVALASRRVSAANAAAALLFGRPQAVLQGLPAEELAASPEDLAWWADVAAGQLQALQSDTIVALPGGEVLHASRSIGLLQLDAAGTGPTHALVMLCDRSAEHSVRCDRELLLADLQATLEATADGILVTDLAGRIRAFNRRFAELWDMPADLLEQRDDAAVQAWMARSVAGMGEQADGNSSGLDSSDQNIGIGNDAMAYDKRLSALRHATLISASDRLQLHAGPVLERVTRPLFSGGLPQGRVWSFRDLTERLAAQERIDTLVLQDGLTGLANRRRLAERLQDATTTARRDGSSFALLVIDLDRFRQINDSLGHDIGDRVLLEVAQRIQSCLRREDMLARIGGDQFAVLVQPADAEAAEAAARRVLNVVAQPCNLDGAQFTITCSIGMALAPSQGGTLDDLARHAEAAMRAVKAAGRANFRLHQARAEGDRRSHMQLDHAMRQALVSGRFRLSYQPQVSLASGAIVGAEALLRWRDPELGEVEPGRFIPVAEDTGFIVAIGDWVLGQAVRQAALWHSSGHAVPVAVNVSALQFQQAHFVDRVARVLAVSGLPPQLLELELTESILLHDADEALHRLHALRALGVMMSIDDFGTGYSSLAYLKRFPIGKLKIDRSFVHGLPGDGSDAGIVRAIVQMAQALGMQVIAEGVESEPQRAFLQQAGCDAFQGHLFAPGLDAFSFEQRLVRLPRPDPQPAQPRQPQTPPPSGRRIRLVRG